MTRYDLVTPRPKKDGSKHWHRVGAAFPRDNGTFALQFDSLPLPDAEGKVYVLMSEAKGRQNAPSSGDAASQAPDTRQSGGDARLGARGPDGFEDPEIPF